MVVVVKGWEKEDDWELMMGVGVRAKGETVIVAVAETRVVAGVDTEAADDEKTLAGGGRDGTATGSSGGGGRGRRARRARVGVGVGMRMGVGMRVGGRARPVRAVAPAVGTKAAAVTVSGEDGVVGQRRSRKKRRVERYVGESDETGLSMVATAVVEDPVDGGATARTATARRPWVLLAAVQQRGEATTTTLDGREVVAPTLLRIDRSVATDAMTTTAAATESAGTRPAPGETTAGTRVSP